MEVRRTVPVKLDVDSNDTVLLEDTVDTFLWSAQYVTNHAFHGEDSDTPHAKYVFSDDYETTGAELHYTNGDWMLHIHCKTDVESDTPDDATENRTVLGVDLGVTNLTVASTGTFWTGEEFDHWRREYEKRRGGRSRGTQ